MIIGCVITGLVGIALLIIGYLIRKKEKISLLHDYHYDKVSAEDKKSFCTLTGTGLAIMGLGLILTAILLGLTESALSFLACAIGFGAGLAPVIHAGNKYNADK